jgi:phosphatidylserine decarboxylase
MRIDPAGWPFIGGAGALAALAAALGVEWLVAVLLTFCAFFLFFFRDPERTVTSAEHAVLSPADGRVMVAGSPAGRGGPPGTWRQISIFLSPMDVHVNRVPVGGRVTKVTYRPGRFLPAYRPDAGELNESTEIWIDHDGQPIVFRQIVGVLARRIVCRLKAGDVVRAGDRCGVMKFGSRMDVFLPPDATITARVGDRVTGAVTVLAELPR